MKRITTLLAALMIMFSLSLTVSAAQESGDEIVNGIVSGQDTASETTGGLMDAAEDSSAALLFSDREQDDAETTETAATEASGTTDPTEATSAADMTEATAPTAPIPTQTAADEPLDTERERPDNTVKIIAIIVGSILLILIVIVAVVMLRRKQTADDGVQPHTFTPRGTAVQIEVLSGMCYNQSLSFSLRRHLTIGTDSGCDLVFEDDRMQPMHAVITRSNGTVTLSECGDTKNTYIGGMKIFAPNRLRSGDIVTVGSTSFCVRFEI